MDSKFNEIKSKKIFDNETISVWETKEKNEEVVFTAVYKDGNIIWSDFSLEKVVKYLETLGHIITIN